MGEFVMPSLGADMDAGTLVEWKVKPGDHVKRGDIVAGVETDKGVIDIEIFQDAVIDQIIVPVGTVLAQIHTGEEGPPPAKPVPAVTPVAVEAPQPAMAVAGPAVPPEAVVAPTTNGKRMRISPLARKMAEEMGVKLDKVTGTGLEGAISRADIERAAAEQKAAAQQKPAEQQKPAAVAPAAPAAPVGETAPAAVTASPAAPKAEEKLPAPGVTEKHAAADFQAGMRRAIAAAMSRANCDIPHYYLETHVDMTRTIQWLEAENVKRPITQRLLMPVLLIKGVAKALCDVPELNGYWVDDKLQVQEAINLGFAISLRQGGLIAPAIHDADTKSLDELMEAMRDLIMRTRAGRLRSSEMSDATITMTNLGDMGVEKVFGVIYPPHVALVGFGKIVEQPWAENGMLGVRKVMVATLAADHRASDGVRGSLFLQALSRHLQEAEKL